MKIISFIFLAYIALTNLGLTQSARDPKRTLDVLLYELELELTNSSDSILVREHVQLIYNTDAKLTLDLIGKKQDGKGMLVHSVEVNGVNVAFEQAAEQLILQGTRIPAGEKVDVNIVMSGIPIDGLVIGKNKYGDRTFFGDNWPNRAHHWFACNDHPSDKAKVNFKVTVPNGFEVIANGSLIREEKDEDFTLFEYRTDYELPTKVIVIGVADFRIADFGPVNSPGVPVSAWVYPQDEQKGFYDMALAPDILAWFERKVAPYPFDKLANVQSTTRYGGMENASCIFYDENAIDGKRSMESLIAHEIAHQWFGNSASERDFSHLWLSEGFATYMTNLYLLETKGEEAFFRQMDKDRSKVLSFGKKIPLPVIDTVSSDLNDLLNANAYQKGSWILHMLRMKLGDDVFWKSVQAYYSTYQFSNATSEDLSDIFEQECSCQLDDFFKQWLHYPANPELSLKFKKRRSATLVKVEQMQKELFDIELDLEFYLAEGQVEKRSIRINERTNALRIELSGKPERIVIDPKRKLLALLR